MAENINIASLDIDTDALKKGLVDLKGEIQELVDSNKVLKKAGEGTSEQFVEQELELKKLRSEYNSQSRVINQVAVSLEKADEAYSKQHKSVNSAAESNKILRQATKNLNTETVEGVQLLEKYNAKIDENAAYMKENSDEQIQGYMSVGEYSNAINESMEAMNPFNILLSGISGGFKEAGGAIPFFTKSLKGAVGGIRAMTVASLQFMLTPIGAVIGAIALAVGALVAYFKTSQEGMDKFTKVAKVLSEVMGELLGVLQVVGKFLVDMFTPGEDAVANFSESVDGLGDRLEDAVKRGQAMADLAVEIREANIDLVASEADYKEALLEQEEIYKDRSKYAEERLEASKNIVEIEEERSRQLIAQERRALKDLRYQQETNDSYELRLEIAKQENKIREEIRRGNEIEVAQLSRINNIKERGQREEIKNLKEIETLQKSIDRVAETEIELRKKDLEKLYDLYNKIYNDETKHIGERRTANLKAAKFKLELAELEVKSLESQLKAIGRITNVERESYELGKKRVESEEALGDFIEENGDFINNYEESLANLERRERRRTNNRLTEAQLQELLRHESEILLRVQEDLTDEYNASNNAFKGVSNSLQTVYQDRKNESVLLNYELKEAKDNLEDLQTSSLKGGSVRHAMYYYGFQDLGEMIVVAGENYEELLDSFNEEDLDLGFSLAKKEVFDNFVEQWSKFSSELSILRIRELEEGEKLDEEEIARKEALMEALAEIEKMRDGELKLIEEEYLIALEEKSDTEIEQAQRVADEIRDINAELTADLIGFGREVFDDKTAVGKALIVAQKIQAMQEWAINNKKAQARKKDLVGESVAELASGQAKTAAAAPFPLNIPLLIGYALQTAGIISAITSMTSSSKPKFEKGGILKGPRHSQGGIQTPFGELEGGEPILTRGVANDPLLLSMAGRLNQLGGGVNFGTGVSMGSTGRSSGFIDYELLGTSVARANMSLPNPIVSVSDIDNVTHRVKVLSDMTSL